MKKSKVTLLTTLLACAIATAGCSHTPKQDPAGPTLAPSNLALHTSYTKPDPSDPVTDRSDPKPDPSDSTLDPSDPAPDTSDPKPDTRDPRDPWEPMNRKTFAFNQFFHKSVSTPIAKGYQHIVPEPVRDGVRNIFRNTSEPASAVNSVFQGKVEQGILCLFRLLINSTAGVGGIFDVASRVDMPRTPTTFSDTLTVWGVAPGPYLVIPLLGPTTVRDGLGTIPEVWLEPNSYIDIGWVAWPWRGLKYISATSQLLPATELLKNTVDPYVAMRSAYLQSRQNLLLYEDGNGQLPQDILNPFDYDDEGEDEELLKKDTKPETKADTKTKAKVDTKTTTKVDKKIEAKADPISAIKEEVKKS
ncbi:MAG: MlaA family lipoprotein [Burkholderiales bacterium]|nr:MlaA family lipoprotein [Burkholderiales bacterium]